MQAKRKHKVTQLEAGDDDSDDPLESNPFSANRGVEAAIGVVVSLIVNNADKDVSIPMFPEPNDFRDMLYEHIDKSAMLNRLLNGDGADEAFMEVRHSYCKESGWQAAIN